MSFFSCHEQCPLHKDMISLFVRGAAIHGENEIFVESLNLWFNRIFLDSLEMLHVCWAHVNKTPQRTARGASLCTASCTCAGLNSYAIFIWLETYFEFIPRVVSVTQYWFYTVLKLKVLCQNIHVSANLDPVDYTVSDRVVREQVTGSKVEWPTWGL